MDDHRWAELERRGFSHREANRLLELGTLTKIRYGVYGEPADLDVLERHRRLIDATWLIIRSGAVLSHFSAAAVHGLPIPATDLNRVWITRPGTSGKTTRWLHLARAELSEAEVCEIDGRLVTSLARTVVDVARRLDLLDGLPLVDAALRAGADRQVLADLLEVEGRRRGNQALRTAVALADPLAESVGESRSRALMWTLGLPMPVLQHPLSDDDGFIGRVDFYWPAHRLVGEFDGKVKYGRTSNPTRIRARPCGRRSSARTASAGPRSSVSSVGPGPTCFSPGCSTVGSGPRSDSTESSECTLGCSVTAHPESTLAPERTGGSETLGCAATAHPEIALVSRVRATFAPCRVGRPRARP